MRQKGFVLLQIVIVLLLLGVVGYFIYQNYLPTKDALKQLSPTSTTQAASSKTYRNSKYSFEIKYPSNWILDDSYEYETTISLQSKDGGNIAQITIDPTNKSKVTIPIENWIKKVNQEPLTHPAQHRLSMVNDSLLIAGIRPVAIDNGWFNATGTAYYLNHNNKVFYFAFSIYEDDVNKTNENLAKQIISNLKFLD